MEVTTKDIILMRNMDNGLPSTVVPVVYQDDEGLEEPPILIMKLSKN
jgi:hypothetical protein